MNLWNCVGTVMCTDYWLSKYFKSGGVCKSSYSSVFTSFYPDTFIWKMGTECNFGRYTI